MSIWLHLMAGAAAGTMDQPVVPETPISARIKSGNVSDLDYPRGTSAEGSTAVDILINPKGRVVKCTTKSSSGTYLLDRRACTVILSRFRYRPYKDEAGKALWVADTVVVHWKVPRF
jgi:TonB family protein